MKKRYQVYVFPKGATGHHSPIKSMGDFDSGDEIQVALEGLPETGGAEEFIVVDAKLGEIVGGGLLQDKSRTAIWKK